MNKKKKKKRPRAFNWKILTKHSKITNITRGLGRPDLFCCSALSRTSCLSRRIRWRCLISCWYWADLLAKSSCCSVRWWLMSPSCSAICFLYPWGGGWTQWRGASWGPGGWLCGHAPSPLLGLSEPLNWVTPGQVSSGRARWITKVITK